MERVQFFNGAITALMEVERAGHRVTEVVTSPPALDFIRNEVRAPMHMKLNPPPERNSLLGFPVVIDPTIPHDEAHLKNSTGEVVGKIVGLAHSP